MESMKPALDALDTIISNVEKSLSIEKGKPDNVKVSVANATSTPPNRPDGSEAPKAEKKKKKEKKPKAPAPPPVAPEISQFLQCDLRVGCVVEVGHHPEADGLFVLQVSYGNEETKTVCAGLRKYIPEEEMKNRLVVTICNLKPRKLRGVASEAMILAGSVVSGEGEKETVVPIAPPDVAAEGDVVSADGIEGERTVTEGKYVSGKVWDKVVPRLGVKDGAACYNGGALKVASGVIGCKLPDGAEIH